MWPRSAPHVQMRGKDRSGRMVVIGAQDHAGTPFSTRKVCGQPGRRSSVRPAVNGRSDSPFHPPGLGDSQPGHDGQLTRLQTC